MATTRHAPFNDRIRRTALATAIALAVFAGKTTAEAHDGAGTGAEPAADAAAAATGDASATGAWPEMIAARRSGFGPEGIEYDPATNRVLVGGLREAGVFEVAPDGEVTPFVTDTSLKSVVGIEVDNERNRLIVCNSDLAALNGARGQAMLGVYDLTTGNPIRMIDLTANLPFGAENFFANDIAEAPDGTLYVSDSAARIIYAVSPQYAVSAIAPLSFLDQQQFFLNGLVYHPDGYLLVADMRHGQIYRVATDGSEEATLVELPEVLIGADGLVWRKPGELVVVSNETDRVSILTSDDGWKSAQIAAQTTLDMMATTATIIDGEVYVVHAHFDAETTPEVYEISRVEFEDE